MSYKLVPLITEDDIRKKVEELGVRISRDYLGKDLLAVGVLKGAWVFMADLVRKLTIPVKCDFLEVASYGSATKSSGVVKIVSDLTQPIEGKDVLLIEDIVDTGLTLNRIKEILSLRRPKSLKVCTLLDKPSRHSTQIDLDYLGFTVPDKFVVGYGIDYADQYRNLPYIAHIEFES